MRKDSQSNTVTGESVYVGDCYVWAEISYLDSPTDYREFLPSAVQPQIMGELALLDDEPVIHLSRKWQGIRELLISAFQIASRL